MLLGRYKKLRIQRDDHLFVEERWIIVALQIIERHRPAVFVAQCHKARHKMHAAGQNRQRSQLTVGKITRLRHHFERNGGNPAVVRSSQTSGSFLCRLQRQMAGLHFLTWNSGNRLCWVSGSKISSVSLPFIGLSPALLTITFRSALSASRKSAAGTDAPSVL